VHIRILFLSIYFFIIGVRVKYYPTCKTYRPPRSSHYKTYPIFSFTRAALTRIQKEHITQVDRCREENRVIEQKLEQQVISLYGQIEEQGRLLDISKREVTQIRDRLQSEVDGRAQDNKQQAMALLFEKERNEDADENVHLQSVEDDKLILRQQSWKRKFNAPSL
jgi:hypothetical protein